MNNNNTGFRFKGMGYKMGMKSPLKSTLTAFRPTNKNQDNKITDRVTTTDAMTMNRMRSPLRKMDPPPGDDESMGAYANPDAVTTDPTKPKLEDSPRINGVTSSVKAKNADGSSSYESRSTSYDSSGYYNPFDTLAKEILQPSTKRAEERVTARHTKRLASLEAKGASEAKIKRVTTRQQDTMSRRFPDKVKETTKK